LEYINYEFLQKQDGYFVEIKVLKVNKNYNFPLMSFKDKKTGTREWTNEPKENLFVCKFELEDLIEFQKIEFEIIRGYYYNEGRNYNLRETIDFLFNERLKMKAEKNPLQEMYKLIMNSSYGKTLLKPIPDEIVFKTDKNIDDFVDKHYNRIKKFQKLNGSNENYERFMVEIEKGINQHYNNASAGCEVLAMSK
jgi:hypothetical protein